MKIYALVLAAGKSRRMGQGTNKLLLPLRGKTVIENTLDIFCSDPRFHGVIVVTSDPFIKELSLERGCLVSPGGDQRQDSVLAGLQLIDDRDYVFIHDGARPFVNKELLDPCFDYVGDGKAFILGIPVTDTIKRVEDGLIKSTPPREEHFLAQTPQGSPVGLLKDAYKRVQDRGLRVTDDASALEIVGEKVYLIPGSEDNRKITSPADMRYLK